MHHRRGRLQRRRGSPRWRPPVRKLPRRAVGSRRKLARAAATWPAPSESTSEMRLTGRVMLSVWHRQEQPHYDRHGKPDHQHERGRERLDTASFAMRIAASIPLRAVFSARARALRCP
jgi:hypothetical protein